MLILAPVGLPFSDAQIDESENIPDNLYKFDSGFYDKINGLSGVSGASGTSSESQYYNVILVTDDKDDLVNELQDNYQAKNIFNPQNLKNVITADIQINLIPELALNHNVVKIGDGLLELESTASYNPNDPLHVSIKQAKEYHGINSQITQTGNRITIGVINLFNSVSHNDLPNSDIIERVKCIERNCTTNFNSLTDFGSTHFNEVASLITGTGDSNSNMVGVAPDSKIRLATAGSAEDRVSALNYLVGKNVDLINVVSGSKTLLCSTSYSSVALIVDSVVRNGIPVIVSNGNYNDSDADFDGISDSACSYNSIAVGNTNISGQIYSSSSRGGGASDTINPDISALGTRIGLATMGTNYDVKIGTSYSAPMVAGASALLLDKDSSLSSNEIRTALLLGAEFGYFSDATAKLYEGTDTSLQNYLNAYGFGKLNIANSLALINNNQFPNIISDVILDSSQTLKYRIHADSGNIVKVLMSWNVETAYQNGVIFAELGQTPLDSLKNYNLEITKPDGTKLTSDSAKQNKEFVFFNADQTGVYEIKVSVDDQGLRTVGYALGSDHPIDKFPYDPNFVPTDIECVSGAICDIGGVPENNSPPVISVTPRNSNANSGDTITLVSTVTDPNDDTTTVSWEIAREDIDIDLTLSNNGKTASFVIPYSNTVSNAFFLIRATATDQYQATSNTASSLVIATISNPVIPPTTPTPDPSTPITPTGSVIFSDDFENGIGKWDITGTWRADLFDEHRIPPSHSSTNKVAESDVCVSDCFMTLQNAINFENYDSEFLQFYRYIDTALDSGEYLKAEIYDGDNWILLDEYTPENNDDNDTWVLENYDLSLYTDVNNFKVRFLSSQSSDNEEVGLDDIMIFGTPKSIPADIIPPVISNIPNDITKIIDSGNSAIVTFDIPTTNEGIISCNHNSGDSFALGTTTIICTATDDSNNISMSSFDVLVKLSDDEIAPMINIPSDKTFEATAILTPLSDSQIGTATANDNRDLSPIVTSNKTDSYPIGQTIIRYTAFDSAGNSVFEDQAITIQDTIIPVLSNIPVDFTSDSSFVNYDIPTATDIFPVTVSCDPEPNSEFVTGNNQVICTATDDNTNSASVIFNVNVLDTPTKSATILRVFDGSFIPFINGMTITNNIPYFMGSSQGLDELQLQLNGTQVGNGKNIRDNGDWGKVWKNTPIDDGFYIITITEQSNNIAYYSIIINAIPPNTPDNFAVLVDLNNLELDFSWDSVLSVTSYTVEKLVDGNYVEVLNVNDNVGSIPITEYSTDATFRVIAHDGTLSSGPSELFTVTIPDNFMTISDDFVSIDDWEFTTEIGTYLTRLGVNLANNEYTFTLNDANGNPEPSGLISGDGFVTTSTISKTFDLSGLNDNTLYLGIDYRATSYFTGSSVTNAILTIEDSSGDVLYNEWLVRGGTLDTQWQQFSRDITNDVSDADSIVVKLSQNDSWISYWRQNAYFDNFYLGYDDPALSGGASGYSDEILPLTPDQILSQNIQKNGADADIVNGTDADIIEELLRNYNHTGN